MTDSCMVLSRTPLRVSLIGGGTDFREFFFQDDGAVFSLPINKYIYVMLNPKFDLGVRVSYSQTENVGLVEHLRHDIIRQCLANYAIDVGIEVVTVADVPGGTGLGSSSALAVGMIEALDYARNGKHTLTLHGVAREAAKVEIEQLGKPIGEQDHFGTAVGRLKLIEFTSLATWATRYTQDNGKELAEWVRLYWLGQREDRGILERQKASIENSRPLLKEMALLARKAGELAAKREYEEIGRLVDKGWQLKKRLDPEICPPAIDDLCESVKMQGAFAAKVCGAGGGGFLMVYAPPDAQLELPCREIPFEIDQEGTKIL